MQFRFYGCALIFKLNKAKYPLRFVDGWWGMLLVGNFVTIGPSSESRMATREITLSLTHL